MSRKPRRDQVARKIPSQPAEALPERARHLRLRTKEFLHGLLRLPDCAHKPDRTVLQEAPKRAPGTAGRSFLNHPSIRHSRRCTRKTTNLRLKQLPDITLE